MKEQKQVNPTIQVEVPAGDDEGVIKTFIVHLSNGKRAQVRAGRLSEGKITEGAFTQLDFYTDEILVSRFTGAIGWIRKGATNVQR